MKSSYPKLRSAKWKHAEGEAPSPPGRLVHLNVMTSQKVPPDKILLSALGGLDDVMILGWDKAGQCYLASSFANSADVLWLLEQMKLDLLNLPQTLGWNEIDG